MFSRRHTNTNVLVLLFSTMFLLLGSAALAAQPDSQLFKNFASQSQQTQRFTVGSETLLWSGKIKTVNYNRNLEKIDLRLDSMVYFGVHENAADPVLGRTPMYSLTLRINGREVSTRQVTAADYWRASEDRYVANLDDVISLFSDTYLLRANTDHVYEILLRVRPAVDLRYLHVHVPKNGIEISSRAAGKESFGPSGRFEFTAATERDTTAPKIYGIFGSGVEKLNQTDSSVTISQTTSGIRIGAGAKRLYIPIVLDQSGEKIGFVVNVVTESVSGSQRDIPTMIVPKIVVTAEGEGKKPVNGFYVIEPNSTEKFTLRVEYQVTESGTYRTLIKGINATDRLPSTNSSVVRLNMPANNVFSVGTRVSIKANTSARTPKVSLDATPKYVNTGNDVELSWSGTDVNTCDVYEARGSKFEIEIATAQPASGRLSVTPTFTAREQSVLYHIACRSMTGRVLARDTISVFLNRPAVTTQSTPTAIKDVTVTNNRVKMTITLSTKNTESIATGPVTLGSIDWGDSQSETIFGLASQPLEKELRHSYERPGRYLVTLTALDGTRATWLVTIGETGATQTTPAAPVATTTRINNPNRPTTATTTRPVTPIPTPTTTKPVVQPTQPTPVVTPRPATTTPPSPTRPVATTTRPTTPVPPVVTPTAPTRPATTTRPTPVPERPAVVETMPQCVSFTTSRTGVTQGEFATLTWSTKNATKVSILRASGDTSEHAANGSIQVNPHRTHTFMLTAYGVQGRANCSVTITVVPKSAGSTGSTTGQVRGIRMYNPLAELARVLETLSSMLDAELQSR